MSVSCWQLQLRSMLVAMIGCFVICGSTATGSLATDERPIPAMFDEPKQFLEAIEKERPKVKRTLPITGITVPHHLLAADLMARGFWIAAHQSYDRIILISPDHFNKGRRPLATTRQDIDTVFGKLRTDREAAGRLLASPALFDDSDLFKAEHGIAALLPFVKHFWPDASIVPIVASYSSTKEDWEAAVVAIEPLVTPTTLIVQSTDYSHYLTHAVAQRRDQETLNVIAADGLDQIARMVQPDHMDSKAAQFIQMRLQAGVRKARGVVAANRNSAEYSALGTKTTSYIVMGYTTDATAGSELTYDDQETWYFGGDVFIGRWMTQPLADTDVRQHIVEEIRKATRGAPMIVNLEGVLLDDPPLGVDRDLHMMHASLAVPILKALNVKAASLANNHSHDLGANGLKETISVLRRAGIVPLQHMQPASLGRLGIVPVNFIGVRDYKNYPVVRQPADLARLCRMNARSPLVAFTHWGEEYTREARPADLAAAQAMHGCGVNAVIGAHSHQASPGIDAPQGGEYQVTFSLGNLLFDQKGERASSALLEVRLFKQGTFATRLVPLPNLFDVATTRLATKAGSEAPIVPAASSEVDESRDLRRPQKRPCVGKRC